MAFYDDKDEDKELGGPQTLGAESGVIGSGGAAGASGEAEGASAAAPKENFVGISQYLNANKPQSEKLAGQVAGNIDQKAAAVDSSLNETQNSFNQAADSQKVAQDDNLLNEVKTNAQAVTGDQAKLGSFAKERDAAYTGPKSLQDLDSGNAWANLQAKLRTAQNAKNAAGTEEGRMGLIKEVSNNPRQSQGALTFDNLLLQSNPNSAGLLKNAGASLGSFDQRSNDAAAAAAAKAKEVSDANAQVSSNAKGAVTGGYQGLRDSLAAREASKDAELLASTNDFKNQINRRDLAPEQLEALGLQPDYQTWRLNGGDYLDYKDGADIYSVANNDDLARQAALQQLAGGSVDLGGDILNSGRELGKTGPGYEFRKDDLDAAQSRSKAAYDQQYNDILKGFFSDPDLVPHLDALKGRSGYNRTISNGGVLGQLSSPGRF